jgi:hypothetical protein
MLLLAASINSTAPPMTCAVEPSNLTLPIACLTSDEAMDAVDSVASNVTDDLTMRTVYKLMSLEGSAKKAALAHLRDLYWG